MPDLKSEMAKVLQSWETPTTIINGHNVTTNSTRRTFEYVRDNPGTTRAQAVAALAGLGVKQSSSTSLLSTFVINGNVRESNGLLYANQQEYAPLKRTTPKPERVVRTEAPVVVAPATLPAPPVDADVKAMIAKMNVMQAREMYDELKTIFGG